MHANVLPFHTLDTCMWTKGKNVFFLKKVMLYILHDAIKMFGIMQTPGLLGWVKRSDIEIVYVSIICLNLVT